MYILIPRCSYLKNFFVNKAFTASQWLFRLLSATYRKQKKTIGEITRNKLKKNVGHDARVRTYPVFSST